jgi:hypothetical protein
MKVAASKRREDASSRRRRLLRKAQTSSRLQKEPHSLNWARAQAILPGPDTEKGKLDLKGLHKKRAVRREAYEAKLLPEVVGATSRAPPEEITEGRSPTNASSIGNENIRAYPRRPTKLFEASSHKGAPEERQRLSEKTEGAEQGWKT